MPLVRASALVLPSSWNWSSLRAAAGAPGVLQVLLVLGGRELLASGLQGSGPAMLLLPWCGRWWWGWEYRMVLPALPAASPPGCLAAAPGAPSICWLCAPKATTP